MSQSNLTEQDIRQKPCSDLGYLIAVRTALVAGLFCAVVCGLLLADYVWRGATDPSEDQRLQEARGKLAGHPNDPEVADSFRSLDLKLRQDYFRHRRFALTGGWLLLGAAVVFLIAAKSAATLRRKLPMPGPQAAPHDYETPMTRVARWSVAALVAVLVVGLITLSLSTRTELASLPQPPEVKPDSQQTLGPPGKPVKPSPQPASYPTEEEIQKNWHRFRGPGGLGISAYDNIPTSWDASSDQGILWKTAVPLPGLNSPVVWNDRVFLSGATEDERQVYCFDANTGRLIWQKDVPTTLPEPLKADDISNDTGFAAPTTTTDGSRVFAIFANGDLAAFDFSGQLAWSKSLGIPKNHYGHASSLEVYRNLLLVQLDQGRTAKEGKSRLLAFDTATGKSVYQVPRPVPSSWTTPCLATVGGGVQLITCADPWVIAYNPSDGSEIWRAACLSGECGPSPVVVDGVVHAGNEYCEWYAIRADGQGDLTDTDYILWKGEDGLPDVCSPVVTSEYVFLVAADLLTCYDAKTGELLWDTWDNEDADFKTNFTSSPSWVAGRLYLFGEDGKGWIIEPTREKPNVIGRTDLGEECVTSPAFQDGRIYIRGNKHLFCIGK